MAFPTTRASIVVLLSLAACGSEEPGAQLTTGGEGGIGAAGSGGSGGEAGAPPAPDPTGWRETGVMAVGRRSHTATRLDDGRVLVVGGEAPGTLKMVNAVEVFDPTTEAFTTLPPLPEPRSNHTATLLADGRVLVVGGGQSSAIGVPSGEGALDSALIFDPSGSFGPTGKLASPRAGHQASLLPDGRVLVVGGGGDMPGDTCTVIPNCTVALALATAELYDPGSGTWSTAAPMAEARLAFTLTALADGSQLAVAGAAEGGSLKTSEVFDATTLAWKTSGSLETQDRLFHAATRLPSGHVLIAGGKKADVAPLETSEVFDPDSGAWSQVGAVDGVRTGSAMLTLDSGHALIVGGYDQLAQATLAKVEIFDEAAAAWTPMAPMVKPRSLHTATLLADGRVLACGGGGSGKGCEISTPP